MKNNNKRARVATLSVCSNLVLIIIKIIAGIFSGSVSIISEAIHSSMDLLASLIAYFSVVFSAKPADKEHPYGHGKIENISGALEGLLIFVAALLIIREAVLKILNPGTLENTIVAAAVMTFAALINLFVSKTLYRAAKEEDSIALEADALHLKTDVWTSAGVAVGMVLIRVTGISILDPIVAMLVACLIIREAYDLCRKAVNPLIDASLSNEEKGRIASVMENYKNQIIDYHQLRTRKSGSVKYIDFHMTVNRDLTVEESHSLSDKIENDIETVLPNASINIHIEPDDADNPVKFDK